MAEAALQRLRTFDPAKPSSATRRIGANQGADLARQREVLGEAWAAREAVVWFGDAYDEAM